MYSIFEKLCKEKGITPYRVSKDTGISTATLSDWKTGKTHPKEDKIQVLADYFGVTPYYLRTGKKKFVMTVNSGDLGKALKSINTESNTDQELETLIDELPVQIPVVKRVAAGIPFDSDEELIGYEEISENMARTGTYFGLQIKGDSMMPGIQNGDIVIVRQQEDAEDGEVVVALVNGCDGCCKRLKKYEDGTIALMSDNPIYAPMYFNTSEIDSTPVRIMGIVKELRRKY